MKTILRDIKIMHFAIALGSMLFFIVANFLNEFKLVSNFDKLDVLDYAALFFVLFCIPASRFMNKKTYAAFKDDGTIETKIKNYKGRVIVRSALLNGAALVSAAAILLGGNLFPALTFIVAWVFLLSVRPTEEEFINDYKLTSQEQRELNGIV